MKFTLATLSGLVAMASAQWETISPGGDTACVQGDFSFFFRPGTTNKLLVEFEGGGVCWTPENCASGALCTTSVNPASKLASLNRAQGVQDHGRDDNPFQEWNHVFVPYCSCDLFVGSTPGTSASGVKHMGAVNAQAAYDFVASRVSSPEDVMVTGCSAGGFGAHFQAPLWFDGFPAANHYHFGDSGMGIVTNNQLSGGRDLWNLGDFIGGSTHVPAYADLDFSFTQPDSFKEFSKGIFVEMSKQYPNATFSTFTAQADAVQIGFLLADGVLTAPFTWQNDMRTLVKSILTDSEDLGNYASYINGGAGHCIIPGNSFYSTVVDGVNLASWVDTMVTGGTIPTDVGGN